MLSLNFQSHVMAGNESFDTAITDLQIVTGPDGLVLVSVSQGGGLASWRLFGGNDPQLAQMRAEVAFGVTGTGPVLATLGSDGVVIAGFAPDVLDTSLVSANANLSSPQDRATGISGNWTHVVEVRDGLLAVSEMGGSGFHLLNDPGSGVLSQAQKINDNPDSYADAIGSMAAARVGGRDFLLVGSSSEQGLTSYEISGKKAIQRDQIGPADGLGLMVPTALDVIEGPTASYVIVASAPDGNGMSGALSVMTLSAGGLLSPTDHVMDTGASRFGQVQTLATVQHDDLIFVAAGGGDDGISLFVLSDAGRLVHLDAFADTLAAGLQSVRAIEMAVSGGVLKIYAAGAEPGITTLSLDLAELGVLRDAGPAGSQQIGTNKADILIDGAGRDTLEGGTGADIYLMSADGHLDQVRSFNPAEDTLDLSDWPFLYDPAGIRIISTNNGARLEWRGEALQVQSYNMQPLDTEAVRSAIQISTNRTFQAPNTLQQGTGSGETLTGSWGNDTLDGGAGNDTLIGDNGDDTIIGGSGTDRVVIGATTSEIEDLIINGTDVTLTTGDGTDEIRSLEFFAFEDQILTLNVLGPIQIIGTPGRDNLSAGTNDNHRILGLDGRDTLTALEGDDSLSGGNGNDVLRGGRGNDTLEGDVGADDIWGDGGNDTIYGADGNDTLRGGRGEDVIQGGNGDDQLRGQREADTLYGRGGDDNLKGGGGNDVLYGGSGSDFLKGGTRRDLIEGGNGNDNLSGNSFDDTLIGGDGRDTLRAGGDDDHLTGGTGADFLKGGSGSDVFVFDIGHDRDVIQDFDTDEDTLILTRDLVGAEATTASVAVNAQVVPGGLFLDFGQGDTILFEGLPSFHGLVNAIEII